MAPKYSMLAALRGIAREKWAARESTSRQTRKSRECKNALLIYVCTM